MTWLIALVGLILRLLTIRTQGTYWFDEAFSVHFASMPLPQAIGFLIRDVHPTLYYILLHVWIRMFGDGEVAVRTLSAILGTLAVLAIGSLATRAFGKRAGLLAGAAAAVSPLLLFQSAEARMYPLLILLVALGTEEFLKLQDDPKRLSWPWAFLMSLACFTHLTAITPFVVMAIARLYALRRDRRALLRFAGVCLLALVPFLIWFLTTALARFSFIGREWQLGAAGDTHVPLLYQFMDFFVNGMAPWQRAFLCVAIVWFFLRPLVTLTSTGRFAWQVKPTKDARHWMLFALAVAPFLAFVSITTSVSKYFVVALPACMALIAGGLDMVLPKSRKALVAVAALWVLLMAGPVSALMFSKRFRYDEVAQFIETRERPGDIVYASWFPSLLPLERTYHGHIPLYAVNPYEGTSSFDESLIMHAGQSMTKQDLDVSSALLARRTQEAKRVFLVTGTSDLDGTPIELWFSERGWILDDTYKSNEWSPIVYLLRKPAK